MKSYDKLLNTLVYGKLNKLKKGINCMNKRLIKKKLKKKEQFEGFIHAEGNNGGDFIEIEDLNDGTVSLKVGHCCVMSVDTIVPVEFLTHIITWKMLEYNNDINKLIDSFEWNKDYKDKLKSKVKNS